jgi:hypothetical protein
MASPWNSLLWESTGMPAWPTGTVTFLFSDIEGLSMAFCKLGLHRDAARIVGCLNGPHSTHPYWRNIPRVQEAWSDIRQALGDELYEACFADGAACTNAELVSWLRDRLNELAPAAGAS